MIILKIILWIILILLGIILLILIIPASAELGYINKKFTYKIRYGFINLYSSDKKGLLYRLLEKRKKSSSSSIDDESDYIPEDIPDDEPEITETDEDFRSKHEHEETSGSPHNEYDSESSDDIDEDEDEECVRVCDDEEDDDENDDEEEKQSKISKFIDKIDEISDKIDKVLDILDSADEPVKKICKGFRFSKVYIDFMIADEDAYKCALKYGKVSGGVYNIIGWLMALCTVKFRTVDIFPDFKEKESRWDISAKLSFSLMTLVIAGIGFLITYIFKFVIPQKKQEKRKKSKK